MNRQTRRRNPVLLFSRPFAPPICRRRRLLHRTTVLGGGKKPLSALEIVVDQLGELVDRHGAALDLAVDEKCRRGRDPKLLGAALRHPIDAVEHFLIRQMVWWEEFATGHVRGKFPAFYSRPTGLTSPVGP